MSTPAPAVSVARGVIHDLGYKRYAGPRRAQSSRWRVILRNQLSYAWQTWWRYKLWVGLSLLITVVIAAGMYAAQTDEIREITRHGAVARRIDWFSLGSIQYYTKIGFLLSLTCGASIVASDLRSGAFTFYFSRPVRPIDYLLGKLGGLFALHLIVMALPMMILMFVRVGLSHDTDELVTQLEFVPKIALIGVLAALVYAAMSLVFSSFFARPAVAIGVWAAYYLIGFLLFAGVGLNSGAGWIATLDFGFALQTMAQRLFGFAIEGQHGLSMPSLVECFIGLGINITFGITMAYWRIRSLAGAGIGGS